MDEAFDPADYVRAAAVLQGLNLDAAETERVTAAFALVMRFAAPALDCPVGPETDPAPVFLP
ncbi:MAG: DUF4089 domain-containing protein [Proteobacteria bacterium]|nr:DUF4089 domain-containing protein [Pseudomonadota bacterium]